MQPPIKRDSHPTASEATTQLKDIRKTLPLRVLSQADWLHWTTRATSSLDRLFQRERRAAGGRALAIRREGSRRSVDLVHAAAARPHDDRAEQHRNARDLQPPSLWDTRMEPRVYDAFVDIWDREDLWVTIDRANLNPPKKNERQSERVHPLGRGHHGAAAADRRAGRAQPAETG